MKLTTRILASLVGLAFLILVSGLTGYRGIALLSESLAYITGPAWNAADGAMESMIGIEAEVIAIDSRFSAFGDQDLALQHMREARSTADEALARMQASGLLQPTDVDKVQATRRQFNIATQDVLESFEQFSRTDEELERHFYQFQSLMTLGEELGDRQVEILSANPRTQISWQGGLKEKWQAADGMMEAQIGLMQRIYHYRRLTGFADQKTTGEELATALAFLSGAIREVIEHPLFQSTPVPEGDYQGQAFASAFSEMMVVHETDFERAVAQWQDYANKRARYVEVANMLLGQIEELEEIGDSTVEGETKSIATLISSANIIILLVIGGALLLAVATAVLVVRTLNTQLGADPSELSASARRLAEGYLPPVQFESVQGVSASLNETIAKLREIISNIQDSADELSLASSQVSSGNIDLSQRTQEQASALEEIAATMEELLQSVTLNSESAEEVNLLAREAQEIARQGSQVMERSIQAMTEIQASSHRIADIITVIDDIAFQTNLLALNAAVEAARAGDQGKGFAVVASEVRQLAARSAQSAREIKGLIEVSAGNVDEGHQLIASSGTMLEDIVQAVQKLSNAIAEINHASREQAMGIKQVNTAILQLDEMTQQNAALVEQVAAASQATGDQANNLTSLTGYFELEGDRRSAQVVTPMESLEYSRSA